MGKVGALRSSAGLGGVAWRPCPGPGSPRHMPPPVASPTGMTEHTKSLLRAFYELSQTHRGKAPPNELHGRRQAPAPSGLSVPTSEGVAAVPGPHARAQAGITAPARASSRGASRCWKEQRWGTLTSCWSLWARSPVRAPSVHLRCHAAYEALTQAGSRLGKRSPGRNGPTAPGAELASGPPCPDPDRALPSDIATSGLAPPSPRPGHGG